MLSMNRQYSTAEVCNLFNVSKSSVFRWEHDGFLGEVKKGKKGRVYSQENLKKICSLTSKKRLAQTYKYAAKIKKRNPSLAGKVLKEEEQEKSVSKFLSGEYLGLQELIEGRSKIENHNIKRLLKYIIENYETHDKAFCQVIRLISEHCDIVAVSE